jgi:hypothetical protein
MSKGAVKAILTKFFLELQQSHVFLVHALSNKPLFVLLVESFVNQSLSRSFFKFLGLV